MAAGGAALGSTIPGLGTAVGAAAGAVAGTVTAAFNWLTSCVKDLDEEVRRAQTET